MDACRVLFDWLLVALDATGRLRRHIVIRVLGSNVRVAIGASIGLVERGLELGFIHEQRDFFAGGIGLGERLIGMALQAGAVRALVRQGGKYAQSDRKS